MPRRFVVEVVVRFCVLGVDARIEVPRAPVANTLVVMKSTIHRTSWAGLTSQFDANVVGTAQIPG